MLRDKKTARARKEFHAERFVLGIIKLQLKSDWKRCRFAHANFVINDGGNESLIMKWSIKVSVVA